MRKYKYKRTKKNIVERLKDNNGLLTQDVIDKQDKSDQKYKSRIKKRVEQMLLQPYTYFFTFTLNDTYIELHQDNHIKKIKATLPQATSYLINNDYGDQTDRLHYHAMASFNHEYDTTLLSKYQYGYTSVKRITEPNAKSLYEYILKLTNHAIKKSVAKIWRSRSKK
jgi:hypothetical protein